jgi:general stress protein YciG
MATNNQNTRGGSSEQHAKAGRMGAEARLKSTSSSTSGKTGSSNRGFASMDPEVQRRIAAEGGRASHQSGRGHEWTSEEARAAGRKGGQASGANRNNNTASAK